MATDQFVLGGIVFDDWMTPDTAPFGGDQAMKVHKLPGGSRVIDILGPDEADLNFKAQIWRADADEVAESLNSMRIAGNPVSLTYGGNFYQVVIRTCMLIIKRYPQLYEFEITCTVASNPMAGNLAVSSSSFGSLVSADMASALSIAGL